MAAKKYSVFKEIGIRKFGGGKIWKFFFRHFCVFRLILTLISVPHMLARPHPIYHVLPWLPWDEWHFHSHLPQSKITLPTAHFKDTIFEMPKISKKIAKIIKSFKIIEKIWRRNNLEIHFCHSCACGSILTLISVPRMLGRPHPIYHVLPWVPLRWMALAFPFATVQNHSAESTFQTYNFWNAKNIKKNRKKIELKNSSKKIWQRKIIKNLTWNFFLVKIIFSFFCCFLCIEKNVKYLHNYWVEKSFSIIVFLGHAKSGYEIWTTSSE